MFFVKKLPVILTVRLEIEEIIWGSKEQKK